MSTSTELIALHRGADLVGPVTPFTPEGRRPDHPPIAVETKLRMRFMQQWLGLSDPALEEALRDVPLCRYLAGPGNRMTRPPDESTILQFELSDSWTVCDTLLEPRA